MIDIVIVVVVCILVGSFCGVFVFFFVVDFGVVVVCGLFECC